MFYAHGFAEIIKPGLKLRSSIRPYLARDAKESKPRFETVNYSLSCSAVQSVYKWISRETVNHD